VDDDPPAAMRYTETRLAPIANEAMLDEIGNDTVDFASNFDGSQQEPTVLPAQLPFLLLNGCTGIAVGMATNIPPHNLGEVVDGLIALLRNPELSDDKLLELIPGPDFPTGGEVLTGSGVRETYLNGRGSIPMRGVAHIEEVQPGKGRHKRGAVVITELPYQLSKAGWIEKLAEQVNDGKITGIADIRDESDREGMRVVVELRRDANPETVLTDLQRRTALQSNYGAILLALVEGKPLQLSLRELLQEFLTYRELTLIRRTRHALKMAEDRLEVVEGLISALNALARVI
jgi:DNA gyrase subunit A